MFLGCAEKTHVINTAKVLKQTKSSNDSIGQKKIETVDRSVTTIYKDIDTSVNTTGKPLTGYITTTAFNNKDTMVALFENNDVGLYLKVDKKTGITTAIATPKSQKTSIKIHEKTTISNDIHIIEAVKSDLKTRTETKVDSNDKHVIDHTYPSAINNSFKKIAIWLLVIIIIAGIAFCRIKKFSVIGLIIGWIKAY
ncbi:MAG: hypothetical protein JWP71_1269 [Mucilaginibacter sp.]|nr:hypothetical protein [Mucilaginibacter sp.]